jgi:hypothetical protein
MTDWDDDERSTRRIIYNRSLPKEDEEYVSVVSIMRNAYKEDRDNGVAPKYNDEKTDDKYEEVVVEEDSVAVEESAKESEKKDGDDAESNEQIIDSLYKKFAYL